MLEPPAAVRGPNEDRFVNGQVAGVIRVSVPFRDRSRRRGRRPVVRPVISVTFPIRKSLLTFVCPAGLYLPANPSRSGSALSVEEIGRGVQGGTVSTRPLLLEEVTMANKDKGGSKSSKAR